MKTLKKVAAAAALTAGGFFGLIGNAHAVPVALELSLVIDVSGSINANEYNLQTDGYQAAFLNSTVQSNILSFAGSGGVAVNVIQFSDNAQQAIGWTLLKTASEITSFANLLGNMARLSSGSTDIEDGMALGISSINTNAYEGARKVIDVSGDGVQNSDPSCSASGACGAVQTQRNAAAAAGILINGLAIEGDFGAAGVTDFYNTNVKTAGGTVYTASSFSQFQTAVTNKIGSEVIGRVPEPGTLTLMGLALAGLVPVTRRRKV